MNTQNIKFTRFPQKDAYSEYLRNITKATEFFIEWFRSEFSISYREMLIKMHQIVTNGYGGYTGGSTEKVRSLFRNHSGVPKIKQSILKKEWYNIDLTGQQYRFPQIKGIPIHLSHHVINLDEGYKLILPKAKMVPYYLCKLESRMNALIPYCVKPGIYHLHLLVNYMNVFVIAHPFEKVNFSICMAQVNAILYMWGYDTLYHEYMDFECFLYDSDVIEDNFVRRIAKRK